MEISTTDVQCPTCCMTARSSDYRHLRPITFETAISGVDQRQCRNCGDVITLDELFVA